MVNSSASPRVWNKGRFMRPSLACLLAGMAVLLAAWTGRIVRAQQGDAPNGNASALRFEVTSVKETKTMLAPGDLAGIRAIAGGTYMARYATLKSMIREMYKITDVQIAGGPNWINTARFDVTAKAEHLDNLGNLNIMFQNMLADRFKLQFRRETRTLPGVGGHDGQERIEDEGQSQSGAVRGSDQA
jgi:hypothetical protein